MSVILVLVVIFVPYRKKFIELQGKFVKLDSDKRSQSSLYGKINEQFAPFMEKYPFEQNKFRFIGNSIDGIQFEKDKIILIEFRSAKSQLNPYQRKIKKMLQGQKEENKVVDWFEFNIR